MKKTVVFLFSIFSFIFFTGCSKDDSIEDIKYDNTIILGSWHDLSVTEGDYISSAIDLIWTFNPNNTASERITLSFNDKIIEDKTVYSSYEFFGTHIKLITKSGTMSDYSVSVSGNKMKLGNTEDGFFDLVKVSSEADIKNK